MAPTSPCSAQAQPLCGLGSAVSLQKPARPARRVRQSIPTFDHPRRQYVLPLPLLSQLRRHKKRQYDPDGPLTANQIDGPPPAVTPTLPLHAPTLTSTTGPAGSTTIPEIPSMPTTIPQILRTRAGISGALVATGVLLGAALLIALLRFLILRSTGKVASSVPSFVRKRLGTTRNVEENLGFVMIEYEDSTWGTPPKLAKDRAEQETSDAYEQSRIFASNDPFISADTPTRRHSAPYAEQTPLSSPEDIQDSAERLQKALSTSAIAMPREPSAQSDLFTISEGDEQDVSDVVLATLNASASQEDEPDFSQEAAEIAHALGLALQNYTSLSTIDSGQARSLTVSRQDRVAAVFALRAGMETVNVRARATGRPRKASDASTSLSDGTASGEFSSNGSLNSSGTELTDAESGHGCDEEVLLEVRRVETRSMDFTKGIVVSVATISDPVQVPQVVVSASTSYDDVRGGSAHPLQAYPSDISDISVSDFPYPPVLLDSVRTMSTSLSQDIEKSLSMALRGDPYFTKRVLSAPSRLSKVPASKAAQTPASSSVQKGELIHSFDVYAM
ncbi:hypothetical protein FA95DRAFT_356283 [Auriscalpium vulgare]|uniref:Uncharacterized protein n=1 Tax=Auriscalpium vulgare TaxID=40419 RepID=A0ACB8S4N0_9AGAM|nr:hypothetical protein FA95DRAFT_356283 [Auriscalpium vulgare]